MARSVTARVTVSVEITVRSECWDDHSTVAQVHREGSDLAVKRITKLCDGYVRLVGTPRVEMIVVEK